MGASSYSITGIPWQHHYLHCTCNPPSGGGASRIHVTTTHQASVWYTLFISYHFLFIRLLLIILWVYFYSVLPLIYIVRFTSFYHHIIVLSWMCITRYNQFIYYLISISMLKYIYLCKVYHDSFTIIHTIF